MMVNHMNNTTLPWQQTVPAQMPWMSSYTASDPTMQFGQTPMNPTDIVPPQSIATTISTSSLPSQPMLSSIASPLQPTSNIYQANLNATPTPIEPVIGNPFNPQPFICQQANTCNTQPLSSCLPQASQLPNQFPSPAFQDSHFVSTSLTQLPPVQQTSPSSYPDLLRPLHQKRSSVEMEDDLTVKEAPPTKQQLSENKLFKRFGTLQLDGEKLTGLSQDEELDSDSSDDSVGKEPGQDQKDLNRYVYLLFKDKKSNNLFNESTSGAMDRLIRDEREKLSKAVILWSPPLKDSLINSLDQDDDDDDDEFSYTDHRDFLKEPKLDDDSIIITEVEDDVPIAEIDQVETDDVMQD